MRRSFQRWRWLALLALLFVLALPAVTFSRTFQDRVLLGVYDPARAFDNAEAIAIEHHFVPWRLDNTTELVSALQQSVNNHRLPMITLESWPWNWNGMTDETLLRDIVDGRYDDSLTQIFEVFSQYSYQTILFRWGHEMEMVDQYPWSKAEAADYIAAYQHVFEMGQAIGDEHLLWVWSPAGNPNAANYWPGDRYVDCVGISIYAAKAWNVENPDRVRSFQTLMEEKYWMADEYDKPMLVAEVGVEGTVAEKERWIAEAIDVLPKFSRVNAWVYFNQRQPDIVPLAIGQPQWQLPADLPRQLVETWRTAYPSLRDQLSPALSSN